MSMSSSKSAINQNQVTANDTTDDEIDLLALLLTLLRGWKTIAICATLALLLGIIYSRYVQPTYQTDALIQIDKKSSGLAALGSNISELVGSEASPAETERELIKSRMVLKPVVDNLHLDIKISDLEIGAIDRIKQGKVPTQVNTANGVALETVDGSILINNFTVPEKYLNTRFTLTPTQSGFELIDAVGENPQPFVGKVGTPMEFKTSEGEISITVGALPSNNHPISITKQSLQATTDALNSALSVTERGKQTGIVQLSMTGPNQKQVSRILEQVILSYVNQNQARGSEQTTTTIEFMESQIPELKQKLEQSEEAFNTFREKYGTIDVNKEGELLLTEQAQIDAQLSELNLKKAELLTYYTTEHPLVVQINDQLSVLQSRKQQIQQTISELPEIQRQFLQLSEDMGINREIYLTMLKNYEQLKIARAGEIGYVRIVDMPINTFNPIAPKKLQIWILALLLGAMLGTLIVFLKNMLRNTIKDPDRLEEKTGVPVIATIPRSKSLSRLGKAKNTSGRLLASVDKNGLSYEGIKSLRTFLMFGLPKVSKANTDENVESTGSVILITGEAPGIGKSFISANLAETFSQLNKKVLIIDGDMRLGELHKTFAMDQKTGLADYLSDRNSNLKDLIEPAGFDYIDIMLRGNKPHNPASLLAGDRFEEMMATLVAIYDYIIIDTPPVLAASDAMIMAQFADKVLMVTRYNQSLEGQLAYAVKQMNKANVVVDGIVLNDMTQGITDKYSYHYNYAYGNQE